MNRGNMQLFITGNVDSSLRDCDEPADTEDGTKSLRRSLNVYCGSVMQVAPVYKYWQLTIVPFFAPDFQ